MAWCNQSTKSSTPTELVGLGQRIKKLKRVPLGVPDASASGMHSHSALRNPNSPNTVTPSLAVSRSRESAFRNPQLFRRILNQRDFLIRQVVKLVDAMQFVNGVSTLAIRRGDCVTPVPQRGYIV